ncbi:hypothetical protein SCUCBS95973_001828 [Sporothrix curviconia]|uniref:Zn(2)-C6 fungal-type domain-containing protein n=1 Tax=Sporothrix curviconia TaxID=1260050 RepID=A0ABP0B1V2_9PEZI
MSSTGPPPGSALAAAAAPGPASSAASSFARPSPARAKRVPDNQRRRAAVSCDHCKQRRAKCMRASPRDPCSNCIANGIKCQSTLPRKQRVYGSVESLSLRYRALEALVKGLLQDEDDAAIADANAGTGADAAGTTDDDAMQDGGNNNNSPAQHAPALDIDALYRAAAARGIPMPPREDMTPASEIFATTASGQPGAAPPTIVPTPLASPSGMATPTSFLSLPSSSANSLPPTPIQPPPPPHHLQHQLPATTLTTPSADEKLIPTPHGVAHYVGPSSSFRFVTSIRALVAQCGDSIDKSLGAGTGANDTNTNNTHISSPTSADGGRHAAGDAASASSQVGAASEVQTSASIRDDFVGLRTSKALEVQDSSGGDEDEQGSDEDSSDDGDDESDSDNYDDDGAMDDVVRDSKAHLRQTTQPSPHQHQHQHQSPDIPFYGQHHQTTLPTRNFTPQSGATEKSGGGGVGASGSGSGAGGGALSAPSPANSRRSRSEFDDAANAATFLPPRETANIFVRVFFDRVHPNYPLFHRNTFLLRYEALWQQPPNESTPVPHAATPSPHANAGESASGGSSGQQDDYGWNCCLAMVFAFGAQILEDHERARRAAAGMQRRYLNLVRSSLSRLAGTTNLANVQALLLLQLYEHNAGQRNAAWTFLGCASRMAVALGMHRDGVAIPVTSMAPPDKKGGNSNQRRGAVTSGGSLVSRVAAAANLPASAISAEQVNDRNARRRVWWTLYSFERSLCIMLGRPSALDETEIAVAAPNDDSQSANLPQGHSASLLKLIRITWRIKQMVFPAPGSAHNFGFSGNQAYGAYYPVSTDPTAIPRQLLSELETWRNSLPAHLQPGWKSTDLSHRRAVLILHVQYQYARSLATRQYVLDRAERCRVQAQVQPSSSTSTSAGGALPTPTPSDDLADICVNSAERALGFCHQLADIDQLDGVAWIDIYFVYHSVLIICLDLLARTVMESAKLTDGKSSGKDKVDAVTARRRTAVRSILQITQRTRMAATFRVLILVACQLAAIVGALDGLLSLPAAANTSSSSSSGGQGGGKHHRASHGSSARSGVGSLTGSGRGRQRRNSSSVSRDRTTSRGPYPPAGQGKAAGSSGGGGGGGTANTFMAPPPASATPQNTSAASDTSSPANMFYSPQTQYEQQRQQQQQQQQQQQHFQQQQHNLHHQIQQLPAFGGADWFSSDPASFPWHTFDAASLGMVTGAASAGLPPDAHMAAPIGSVGSAAAAAAAAAAQFPVAFFQPQGIDFGMTSDTSTFAEDPYMTDHHHHHSHNHGHHTQQQLYQMSRGGGGDGGGGGGGGDGGNTANSGSAPVPPTAAFATDSGGGMEIELGHHAAQHHASMQQQQQQHLQQQQYLQHPPQLDNHEWQQVFREYNTRHQ